MITTASALAPTAAVAPLPADAVVVGAAAATTEQTDTIYAH